MLGDKAWHTVGVAVHPKVVGWVEFRALSRLVEDPSELLTSYSYYIFQLNGLSLNLL